MSGLAGKGLMLQMTTYCITMITVGYLSVVHGEKGGTVYSASKQLL